MITSKASPYEVRRQYLTNKDLHEAYALGLIPKHELVDGQWYLGACRNSEYARWNAKTQKFDYRRQKFSQIFWDEIEHPEDDTGFDLFFATQITTDPLGESDEQLCCPPAEHTA